MTQKIYYTHETSKTTVGSQMLPPKVTQPQKYVVTTEQPPENQTGNELVPFLNCTNNCFTDVQESEQYVTTTLIGDTTILMTLFDEGLVKDEQTNEVYLPLTSTVVPKRKQVMLYVPLDFNNNLTLDALVDSKTYVSAIAPKDLDTIKQKAPNNFLKSR